MMGDWFSYSIDLYGVDNTLIFQGVETQMVVDLSKARTSDTPPPIFSDKKMA